MRRSGTLGGIRFVDPFATKLPNGRFPKAPFDDERMRPFPEVGAEGVELLAQAREHLSRYRRVLAQAARANGAQSLSERKSPTRRSDSRSVTSVDKD